MKKAETNKALKISDIKPAPYNPRMISDDQAKGLKYSIDQFGDISGITFNMKTGFLVTGHQRFNEIKTGAKIQNFREYKDDVGTVGYADIVTKDKKIFDLRVVDWDETKEKAANIAANSQFISGEFVIDGLGDLLDELQDYEGFGELNFQDLADEFDIVIGDVPPHDPTVPKGDHPGVRTSTFTVSSRQYELIEKVINQVIQKEELSDPAGLNDNKNGNALYHICKTYSEK